MAIVNRERHMEQPICQKTPSTICSRLEAALISFGIFFFQTFFFFLRAPTQSSMVSFLHYAIFAIGLYYFIYKADSKGIYRILFFLFVLFSFICYLVFNKCLLTHIELGISNEKNMIQHTIETFFGSQIEGNTSSKVALSMMTLVTGLFILHDYGIFKVSEQ
jgi:hypothetical protein